MIALAVAVVSLVVFNQMKFKPMQQQFDKQIEQQNKLIKDLSEKETYRIDNSFRKVKAKDGSIDLRLNSNIIQDDSTSTQSKRRRLFNMFKK